MVVLARRCFCRFLLHRFSTQLRQEEAAYTYRERGETAYGQRSVQVANTLVDVTRDGNVFDAPNDLAFFYFERQAPRVGERARNDVALSQSQGVLNKQSFVDACQHFLE